MLRFTPFALTLLLALSPLACKKDEASTTPTDTTAKGEGHEHHGEGHDEHGDFEGREVVDNWMAQVGDVTVCPISGNKFEVKEDSGRYEHQGYTFVLCCEHCTEKVKAEPGKYLDKLVEQAGDPASDPDKTADGAVDGT